MKRNLLLLSLITISSLTVFNSCGDKEDTTPDDTKTLDKSKVYDKEWYIKGESFYTHKFNSNGDYNISGSWEWIDNTDEMKIIPFSNGTPQDWFFIYSTDNEMSCKNGINGSEIIYKTSPW